LLPPVSGTVENSADRGDQARYFAEDGHIFATSVRENLLVSCGDATDEMLTAAIDKVGLTAWIAGLPDGLDTALEAGADSISGGQRRRLLLARAVINPAPVLLIDEAGENLDQGDAATLQAALLDVDGGLLDSRRAVIVVTHQLPRDHRADQVLDLTRFSPTEKAVADLRYRG
jgi:ATP-binding cassette subfamily C protein CydC